jgi:hypothetical protein
MCRVLQVMNCGFVDRRHSRSQVPPISFFFASIALILDCRLIEASHTDREFQNSDLFVEWQSYCDGKVRSAAGFRRNLRGSGQGQNSEKRQEQCWPLAPHCTGYVSE